MPGIPNIRGPFTRIKYEDTNLNSSEQLKSYLLSVGWVPTEYNRVREADGNWRTTSPKLTEDSFDSIEGETGKLIARRSILVHRRRTILNYDDPENKGILSCIRDDGRVPAEGITCATPTGRTTHRKAVCNVPKAKPKIVYGKEMRSLFCTKAPYVMLGADLDQIEARVTAHYAAIFDGGAYMDIVLEGDIHQRNADLIHSDRDTAKSFQYALFYGAKAVKLSKIIGCSPNKAEKYIEAFWGGNKGVKDLVDYLEKYYDEYRFIKGLDGRKIFIRAKYKLLNSLIQTAAGIVFKVWGNLCDKELRESGVDCSRIISYHDEYDFRCHRDSIELAIPIIKSTAEEAGRILEMNVPITVDVKIGMNWAEVH